MAGAQVTVVANQIEKQRLGYQAISLTNFASDTLEPEIAEGSKVEIGGALYEFASNESITGWAGIANSSDVYIHLTASGASVTASFSTTAPTWDMAKQGWYSGSVRVIGGLYKDSGGNYARKWLYKEGPEIRWKALGDDAVRTAAIQDGAVTGAKIDASTLTESIQSVLAGSYVLPAGLWIVYFASEGTTGYLEVRMQGTWRILLQAVGEMTFIISDGTNVRLTDEGNAYPSIFHLRKLT